VFPFCLIIADPTCGHRPHLPPATRSPYDPACGPRKRWKEHDGDASDPTRLALINLAFWKGMERDELNHCDD